MAGTVFFDILERMRKTSFIASAFLFHLLVGNFCLINTAEAMMDALQPEVATHASYTDLLPMSKREPATCPWTLNDPVDDAEQRSPCDDGQCFVPPSPQPASPDLAPSEITAASIPMPPGDNDTLLASTDIRLPVLAERPPPLIAVKTIVLRQ